MILEDATWEAFGYELWELLPQSSKPILAACEVCGRFKIISKYNYRTFCRSCCSIYGGNQKGKNNPMFGKKGEKSHMFGKHLTEEVKAVLSIANKGEKHPNYGKRGKDASGYIDGEKAAGARARAKRRRDLSYTLLLPLEDGEVGHHVTNEYVIGIPKEVHEKLAARRKNHRVRVLKWLKENDKRKYKIILSVLAKESLPVWITNRSKPKSLYRSRLYIIIGKIKMYEYSVICDDKEQAMRLRYLVMKFFENEE